MIDTSKSKMLGPATRVCDSKHCTCNASPRARVAVKRAAKRRERQAVARLIRLTY